MIISFPLEHTEFKINCILLNLQIRAYGSEYYKMPSINTTEINHAKIANPEAYG